jgi:hypothetical protein
MAARSEAIGVIADAVFSAPASARPITADQLDALEAAAPYVGVAVRELDIEVERAGRCVGTDPEAYYPIYREEPHRTEGLLEERAEARWLCHDCPVLGQCLARDYLHSGGKVGDIWGVAAGLGARDRRALLPHWVTLTQRLATRSAAAADETPVAS